MPLSIYLVRKAASLAERDIARSKHEAWNITIKPHWKVGDANGKYKNRPEEQERGKDVRAIGHFPAYIQTA